MSALRAPAAGYGSGPVALRLLAPADAGDFLAGFSDPVVHENTYGGRLAPTMDAVSAYLARVERRLRDGEALILAVLGRDDGAFLGTTMLFRFDEPGIAEVGFWLGRRARGRGLGAATIALTNRWGFEELGLRRIEGLTAPGNHASQRAMARAGMQRDGVAAGLVRYAAQASDED